jgi:hypothetical protein
MYPAAYFSLLQLDSLIAGATKEAHWEDKYCEKIIHGDSCLRGTRAGIKEELHSRRRQLQQQPLISFNQ